MCWGIESFRNDFHSIAIAVGYIPNINEGISMQICDIALSDGNLNVYFSPTSSTISLISHTGKIVARILSKRLGSKIGEVIEEVWEKMD